MACKKESKNIFLGFENSDSEEEEEEDYNDNNDVTPIPAATARTKASAAAAGTKAPVAASLPATPPAASASAVTVAPIAGADAAPTIDVAGAPVPIIDTIDAAGVHIDAAALPVPIANATVATGPTPSDALANAPAIAAASFITSMPAFTMTSFITYSPPAPLADISNAKKRKAGADAEDAGAMKKPRKEHSNKGIRRGARAPTAGAAEGSTCPLPHRPGSGHKVTPAVRGARMPCDDAVMPKALAVMQEWNAERAPSTIVGDIFNLTLFLGPDYMTLVTNGVRDELAVDGGGDIDGNDGGALTAAMMRRLMRKEAVLMATAMTVMAAGLPFPSSRQ
ncbi:hypothetical protein C8R44DRAFT_729679 [Mycena epipterygia]|nr:hypothetical protein C8R44DRAFT_729679 [Mycena epipterygia]